MPSGLPGFGFPAVDPGYVSALLPSALALAAVGAADGLLTARRFAEQRGQRIDGNAELVAFGLANVAAGVTSAFNCGASASRSAASDASRGRTQLVCLVRPGSSRSS